jgi:hypothetical protein
MGVIFISNRFRISLYMWHILAVHLPYTLHTHYRSRCYQTHHACFLKKLGLKMKDGVISGPTLFEKILLGYQFVQ